MLHLIPTSIKFLSNLYYKLWILVFKSKPVLINNLNDIVFIIPPQQFKLFVKICHSHSLLALKQLTEITTTHLITDKYIFYLSYFFRSQQFITTITIKILLREGDNSYSINLFFKSASWLERESFDLFGICFTGNPDCRRILTDYGFNSHALLKEYPLLGFCDLVYNDETKRIELPKIPGLIQELRVFKFKDEWKYPKPVWRGF